MRTTNDDTQRSASQPTADPSARPCDPLQCTDANEPRRGDALTDGFGGFANCGPATEELKAAAMTWYFEGRPEPQSTFSHQSGNVATTGEQLHVAASGAVVNVAEIKKQYPALDALDDNQVVDALHQAFYADLPREQVAEALGVKSDAALTQSSSLIRTDEEQGDDYDPAAFGEAGLPHALAIDASADINTEFGIAS